MFIANDGALHRGCQAHNIQAQIGHFDTVFFVQKLGLDILHYILINYVSALQIRLF